MNSVLPGITTPEDTACLWRYMSFEKFVSLLATKTLFFTRADKFDDPFEGFTPPSVTLPTAERSGYLRPILSKPAIQAKNHSQFSSEYHMFFRFVIDLIVFEIGCSHASTAHNQAIIT